MKEFRNILLGQRIKVHTDYENLTYKTFNSERVMRWRLYIEEYSPDLHYIKGESNVVADALSRLDMKETPFEDTAETFLGLMECFGKEPALDYHPLNYKHLHHAQLADKSLMKILQKDESPYSEQEFHGGGGTTSLSCYKGKIVNSCLTTEACNSLVSHHSLSPWDKQN